MKQYRMMIAWVVTLGLAFLGAVTVDARSLEVSRYVIDAAIQETGDVQFTEEVTFEAEGHYNGVFYNLDYQGVEEPTDVRVTLVPSEGGPIELEEADTGQAETYEVSRDGSLLQYKVYLPFGDSSRTVRFQYTLPHLITNYNDTAEFNRRVVGANWEIPQSNITVHVTLPQVATRETLRAWGHGGRGTVTIDSDYRGVTWQVAANDPGHFVEAHMIFPQTLTRLNTNVVASDGFDRIIAGEEALITRAEEQKESSRRLGVIGAVLTVLSLGWTWWGGRRAYHKKMAAVPYVPDHLFEIPQDLTPAIMDAAIYDEVDMSDVTATVMDLVRRGVIQMSESEPYTLTLLSHHQKLLAHENYLIEMLFTRITKSNELPLTTINAYAEAHPDRYARMIGKWKRLVYEAAQPYQATTLEADEKKGQNKAGLVVTIIFLLVTVFGVLTATEQVGIIILTVIGALVVGGLATFFSGILLTHRSVQGEYEYRRWQAFRQMLLDISTLDRAEVMAIQLWDHILVYAISLGVAKEVIAALTKHFPEVLETSVFYTPDTGLQWTIYHQTLQHTFASSYNTAVDIPSSSNSGGFGGGFSGGSSFGSGGASGGGGF